MDWIIAIHGEKWSNFCKASMGWLWTLKEKGIPLFLPVFIFFSCFSLLTKFHLQKSILAESNDEWALILWKQPNSSPFFRSLLTVSHSQQVANAVCCGTANGDSSENGSYMRFVVCLCLLDIKSAVNWKPLNKNRDEIMPRKALMHGVRWLVYMARYMVQAELEAS